MIYQTVKAAKERCFMRFYQKYKSMWNNLQDFLTPLDEDGIG